MLTGGSVLAQQGNLGSDAQMAQLQQPSLLVSL